MRIAFAGSSGTGKTTLAAWASEKYGLPMCPVGSRSTAKRLGFDNPYDVDFADRKKYEHRTGLGFSVSLAAQHSMLKDARDPGSHSLRREHPLPARLNMRPVFQEMLAAGKVAWESVTESFCVDRSTIDDLTYACIHCLPVVNTAFIDRALNGLKRYDVVFYCPVGVFCSVGGDKSRMKDMAYHRITDAMILGWLTQNTLFSMMNSPDIEERKAKVRKYLG